MNIDTFVFIFYKLSFIRNIPICVKVGHFCVFLLFKNPIKYYETISFPLCVVISYSCFTKNIFFVCLIQSNWSGSKREWSRGLLELYLLFGSFLKNIFLNTFHQKKRGIKFKMSSFPFGTAPIALDETSKKFNVWEGPRLWMRTMHSFSVTGFFKNENNFIGTMSLDFRPIFSSVYRVFSAVAFPPAFLQFFQMAEFYFRK